MTPITALRPVFTPRPASFDGFVHREATRLVDGTGRDLVLRGVGLGNWLLPEGYMWKFGPGAESPREIEALVARLAGADYADGFWLRYRDEFITEADIARIAACGFDHVRLPINSRILQTADGDPIEAGYRLIDRLIGWCRSHRLWVLLDLHGAPGGQTGTNIDDSPHGLPELFMDDRYRALTLRLWRDLATRYRDETVVLGYDLLNEPLPNQWQHRYADDLATLYRDLTAAVRAIDDRHLLQYEGAHWATNFAMIDEVWDDNSALHFHKYWSPPDRASIAGFLQLRDRLGLPLYMGEGGENNLDWLYAAFRLYESEQIGWNFWPWKKLDTLTSPVSVQPPAGWDLVVASIDRPAQLTQAEARRVFDDLLGSFDPATAGWQPAVVAALTGEHPRTIPAWAFTGSGPGTVAAPGDRVPGFRSEAPVPIRFAFPGDNPDNPFAHNAGRPYTRNELLIVALGAGEWLDFDLAPGTTADAAVGLDQDGQPAPVRIARTPGGVRVTASRATTLAHIHLGGADE